MLKVNHNSCIIEPCFCTISRASAIINDINLNISWHFSPVLIEFVRVGELREGLEILSRIGVIKLAKALTDPRDLLL